MGYCTIVGFIICAFLYNFLLDKLLAVCYNGNLHASHPGARRLNFVHYAQKAHRFCKPKPKAVGKFNSKVF
jgi:hypothetical protein